jgi:hypothetical protein
MALGGSQGQAIVLDNPRDPLAIYTSGERAKSQDAYRQQQLGMNQQRQDNTRIKDLLSYKYDKPEDRFLQWGQGLINKANNDVFSILNNNPNQDLNSLSSQIRQRQGDTQVQLDKANEISSLYKDKQASIGSLKNVDKSMAASIMNQTIAKDDPNQVDTELLQNIEQVPAIYDLNGLVSDSVSEVKNQYRTSEPGALQTSPLGQFIEITDHKLRFKDIDKTMDYILRGDDVTENGINQKINGGVISDRIRYDIARQEVADKGGDPNDVSQVMSRFKEIQYDSKYAPKVRENLKGILNQLNQEERDVKVQSMGRFKQPSAKEQDYQNSKTRREEALDALVAPFGKSGELSAPSKKSSESLGKLRGGDFLGGKVIDAKFEKGGYVLSPEYTKRIRDAFGTPEGYQLIQEAKNHRVPVKANGNKILFTTKTGTMFGAPETQVDIPLDLSNPDAKDVLNAMMNQNAGERKVIYDDLYQKNSKSPQYLDDDDEEEGGFLDD